MNVTVDIRSLAKALGPCKKITESTYLLPVLRGVVLTVEGGVLRVSAGGPTRWDATVPALNVDPGHADGAVLVDCAALVRLVKGRGAINLASDGPTLHVVNGIESSLPLLALDEYPKGPEVEWSAAVPVDMATVAEVALAASGDDARPILAAVLFRGREIVATDSYRLHLARVDANYPEALVPARYLPLVGKGVASVSFGTEWVRFEGGGGALSVRLMDGTYPNYPPLIPKDQPVAATVEREGFLQLVSQVGAVVARSASPIRLAVEWSELVCSALNFDTGQKSSGRVPVKVVGDFPYCAFNPTFLADALSTLTGETVTIGATDALKPFMLSETRENGSEAVRLLMPVRVS